MVQWGMSRAHRIAPDAVAHLDGEAITYLERQEVDVVPVRGLPDWIVLTVGDTELSQWFGGRERQGDVFMLWYLQTPEQREAHRRSVLHLDPKAQRAEGWGVVAVGDAVYATKRDAVQAARGLAALGRDGIQTAWVADNPRLPKGWSQARAAHQSRRAGSRRASAGMSSQDFDQDQLRRGTAQEMREHGLDARVAQRIAMDHLAADPGYYSNPGPRVLVFDNGGATYDRYTVVLPEYATQQYAGPGPRYEWDPHMLLCAGGSQDPFAPRGVGWVEACHVERLRDWKKERAEIKLSDLPPKMRKLADEVISDPEGHGGHRISELRNANPIYEVRFRATFDTLVDGDNPDDATSDAHIPEGNGTVYVPNSFEVVKVRQRNPSVGGVLRGAAAVAGAIAGGFAAKKLYDATKG